MSRGIQVGEGIFECRHYFVWPLTVYFGCIIYCCFVDTIDRADVGLRDEYQEDDRGHGLLGLSMFNRVDRWAQPITYVDMYEGDSFNVRLLVFVCLLFAFSF